MSVTLTDAAARHVTRYMTRRGKGVGVRLGVKTTGCSGLAYKLEYADEIAPEDVVFEDNGVKETFADDFVGLYGVGPNFHLTFATRRPVSQKPGAARFVCSRLVLPLEAAVELYAALDSAVSSLESRGVVKRRPAAAKADKE